MELKDQLMLLDMQVLSRLVVGIGEAAETTGVPQRKIRYWEEKGIIQSVNEKEGDKSTRSRYDYLTIKKILLIQELLDDGFTLDAAAKRVDERIRKINEAFAKLAPYQESREDL